MITTELINRSGHHLTVKEGNGGVYSTVAEISDGESFTLSLNTYSTYREFKISATDCDPLIVTSDDLEDNETITVSCEKEKLSMIKTPRGASSTSTGSSWFGRIASRLALFKLQSCGRTRTRTKNSPLK
jgi:hypothetical protein